MFRKGEVFLGSVDGNTFKITEYRTIRVNIGLTPDYTMVDNKGKIVYITESLLNWLVKSGGLLRDF